MPKRRPTREQQAAHIKAIMQRQAQDLNLGPSGKHPEGKLFDGDQGEIQVAVTTLAGKVFLNFGVDVSFIGFSPSQAIDVARLLLQHAKAAIEN